MQLSRKTIQSLNKWLAIFVVGFLVLAPISPTFVNAQSEDDTNPDGNDFSEEIQNDPAGYIDDVLANLENSNYGPNVDDGDGADEEEVDNDEDANDGADDGEPGPEGQPGSDNDDDDGDDEDEGEIDNDDDTNDNGEGEEGDEDDDGDDTPGPDGINFDPSDPTNYEYQRPNVGTPSEINDVEDIIENLPRTLEEAVQWHEDHFDEQEVDTGDATANGETSTTTGEPETTAQNNTDDTDDSIVNDTASTTTDADIESDQELEQDNYTTGEAVSGDNTLHSEKDVLEGTITTGNSDITSEGQVQGNTSNVSTGNGGGGWVERLWGSQAGNNANDTDDSALNAEGQEVKELTILNKNKAFVSNVKELLAKSGGNRLSGVGRVTDGGIYTGASRAKSSLLNIINTNTVDSAFLPITFDIFDTFTGNIDIMDILFEAFGVALNGPGVVVADAENNANDTDDSILNAEARAFKDLDITNENEGYIYNDLDIKGISGQNQVLAGRKIKEVDIKTGRVDVTNNLVNFLNTNLFKSKIGVVVINVFSDWAGNLIIPGAGKLAMDIPDPTGVSADTETNANDTDDSINSALAVANSDLEVISENIGGVQTDINILANTGNNYTSFDKDADNVNIRTGQAKTLTNMLTLANRDIVGAAFSQGFFNILGDWTGGVVGVSQNARVEGDGNSFIVADEAAALTTGSVGGGAANAGNNTNDTDDSIINAEAEVGRSVKVNNKNLGMIANKLDIVADSGTNDLASYKGQDINIDTGDVGVSNNIANFMNNNFAFSKGLVVALNVFGKWRGNVAYDDVKDLTVDLALASDTDDLEPGDELAYEVSAINSGTQPTDPGTMTMAYDANRMDLVDADGGSADGSNISWDFPQMESAESTSHTPVFELKEDLPEGEYEVEAAVSATQQDELQDNNRIRSRVSFRIGERDTGLPGNTVVPDNSGSGDSDNNENNSGDSGNTDQATGGSSDSTDTGNNNDNNNGNDSNNTNAGSGPAPKTSTGANSGYSHTPGYLRVEKTVASPGPYSPGDSVSYTLTITNPGDTRIDDVVIYDSLSNGDIKAEVSWPIDYVERAEKVTIDYEITVQDDAPSGVYTNGAYASGFDAANAVIRSPKASTEITVENPNYVANSGAIAGSAGTLDTIEVLDSFNADATPTEEIVREEADGSDAAEGTTTTSLTAGTTNTTRAAISPGGSSSGKLSTEQEAELEEGFEASIRETSRVKRFIPVASAPAAVAAEGVYLDHEGKVLGAESDLSGEPSQKLAYAVYPNFLHFDGMATQEPAETAEGPAAWFASSWLIWTLFVIALVIGYLSFREKQRQQRITKW